MMPIEKKSYRQIVGDILKRLGEDYEQFTYSKTKARYFLLGRVVEVLDVFGVSGGEKRRFKKDEDYRFSENFLEWRYGGGRPDEGSEFTVVYKSERPQITDTSPGSVARTLIESISREIEYLNELIVQAYDSGFIDTASGDSLDLVVALLGMRRKPPQPASGLVTFGRRSEPETLQVNGEVILYDGSVEYQLKSKMVKAVLAVKGVTGGQKVTYRRDVDYAVAGRKIRWLPSGMMPDDGSTFSVDYVAYREILIPKNTRVSTYSTKPEEVKTYVTMEDKMLDVSAEGVWEVDVPVVSTTPGPFGNVLAGTVTVLPQPLMGIEYVINKNDIGGGIDAEGDRELRDRAKRALEIAGKATLPSLETAIRSVEGVSSVLVKDSPEGVPGIVKVIADGGDHDRILDAIEKTRAAGIKVEFMRPRSVYVDAELTLVLKKDAREVEASRRVEALIRSYISSLGIGDDVLFYKIASLALEVEGVVDVTDIVVSAYRGRSETIRSEKENIEISDEEKALARNVTIAFRRSDRT